MTKFDKEKILEQLKSLKKLPQVKEVKALKKRFELELQRLEEKIKPEKEIQEFAEISKEQKRINANVKRSKYMKHGWGYLKQMYDNYPELRGQYKIKEIFSMYAKRRKGQKVPIGDVYWQTISL
jgi:GTPase